MAGTRICLECGATMIWNEVSHCWWCVDCPNMLSEEKGFGLIKESTHSNIVDAKYSKPLTLADLSKAYELLNPYKINYDVIAVPQNMIKKIPQADKTTQHPFGIKIITIPEEKRKGLFKWKLFRLLFSSTKNIVKEWRWNHHTFLISTKNLYKIINIDNAYKINIAERIRCNEKGER